MTDIEKMAREAGMEVVMYMTNPPRLMGATANAKQLEAFAQAVARRCADLAEWRGALQKDRAMAEGNDYAGERAIEAEACAAVIRAEFGIKEEP